MDEVFFNPFDPGFRADPYPQYQALLSQAPISHSPIGAWVVTRYDDCLAILRDPRSSADRTKSTMANTFNDLLEQYVSPLSQEIRTGSMLGLDPPDHTRLRRLVSKAFTPRAIDALRPRIQQLVDEMIDGLDPGGADLVPAVAFPLPFAVICELLGMPDRDRDQMRSWSNTIVRTLEPMVTVEEVAAANEATELMAGYIRSVLAERRASPRDDLLSALISAEEEGDRLSETELLATVFLLYIAGHETTVNLIGNGVIALLRNPGELARLRDDSTLDANAADELLRFDGPVQVTGRAMLEAVELDGHRFEAGDMVITLLGAANHDPSVFTDPDRLDVGRPNANRHLALSHGAHYCLGANLARAEGAIAIGTLIRRLDGLALDGEPAWKDSFTLRGPAALPVSFRGIRPRA